MADLDPAQERYGRWRTPDRRRSGRPAVDVERRDSAVPGAGVGVANIQLRGVGGPELCTDRPEVLRREGGPGRGDQATGRSHREAVDQRGVVTGADQTVGRCVEEPSPTPEPSGTDTVDSGLGEQPVVAKLEARVVAAAVAHVGDVHPTLPGDGETDGTTPPDQTGTRRGSGCVAMSRSTENCLLPASTATRYRPWGEVWMAPCEARPSPEPAPPITKGDPARGVRDPSAWRSNAATVLTPSCCR